MSDPTPARPRQVTLAAGLIMGGSLLVVLLVFDRIAGLHTLETRESIERFLSSPPGSDLGVGVAGVQTMIRTFAMVAAGCATAAAILGYQVLRRSRSARLALTVLAVPLFVTGMVTGGFVSSVVAASAVLLWLQPARDWFDGVSRPRPDPVAPASAPRSAATPPPTSAPPTSATPAWSAKPVATQTAPHAPAPAPTAAPAARPAAVVWACCLTWVFTGLTVLALAASTVAIALEPDQLFAEARRQNPELSTQGISDRMLAGVAYAMVGAIIVWCLSAAVLAVLVLRRVEWARIVLVVSAATAAALCVVGSLLGAFLLVAPLLASGLTIRLLVRADTRRWCARAPRPSR